MKENFSDFHDNNNPEQKTNILTEKDHIEKIARELANELADKEMVEKYGTSIVQNMSRDYTKTIQKKYYKLKKEFDQINIDNNSYLSFDELYNFFKNRKNSENITKEYIERLFILLDKNKDEKITLEEFIFSYIKLEERLILKKTKLNLLSNDLKSSLKEYEEKYEKTKNQIVNKDGICENANLSITLFEAKDLVPFSSNTKPNTFVIFSLNGIKQQSNLIENTNNPIYFEDFTFPITNSGEILKVEVYDQSNFSGTQLIGQISIDLVLLNHQQKTENWYSLSLVDNNTVTSSGNGSIHLQLRYIYDWHKYYSDLIETTKMQIKRLNEDISELDKYQNYFNEPFGIIEAGKINSIIDKRIFEKSEDILDYISSTRRSIYVTRESMKKFNNNFNNNNIINLELNENIGYEFNKAIIYLIYICFLLTICEFLARNDYLTLLLFFMTLNVIYKRNKNLIDTYCEYLIRGFLICLSFDVVWLYLNFGGFMIKNKEKKFNLFICYIVSFANFIGKIIIWFYLYIRNKNIYEIREGERNKILKNKINT